MSKQQAIEDERRRGGRHTTTERDLVSYYNTTQTFHNCINAYALGTGNTVIMRSPMDCPRHLLKFKLLFNCRGLYQKNKYRHRLVKVS